MCLYPETVPRKSFKESLREGKLVKNFEIFGMNNRTVIKFGFRRM